MIGLSIDRLKHCLAVARKMKAIAESIDGFPYPPEDMFYLGLLHDVAYEFVDTQEEHEHCGGEILRNNGYRYWKEVYYHGNPDIDYCSRALDLLNYADLTTDTSGMDTTIDARLNDIAQRYGPDSAQYQNAFLLAEQIRSILGSLNCTISI